MSEFFLGCDVSKGYADFIILDRQENVVEKVFQLDDTVDGHGALSAVVATFFKRNNQCILCAGLESTGGYENNWFGLLMNLSKSYDGLKVARVNPLAVKKHHEASMRRNITDAISAFNIATYLISYPKQVRYNQDISYRGLRTHWNFIQQLLSQRTEILNAMGFLIYQSHPELVRFCKNSTPMWILEVLTRYPTAANLACAKPAVVAKIPHITLEKATSLINDAKQSVAAHLDQPDGVVIKAMACQVKSLDESIAKQKDLIIETANLPDIDLLCSFKGIGAYSAIGLLINIGSLARFPTVKHLVSYFGIHPVYCQSGDGAWGFHMSKQGRKQPRAILFMVALGAINSNPVIRQLYEKCLKNGMEKMAAIGVCMHKILRIVYGMLKSNKPFDPLVDQANRKKFVQKKPAEQRDGPKRRYQQHDSKAPLSRRQVITRKNKKGTNKPQENIVPVNEVLPSLTTKNNTVNTKNQPHNGNVPVRINEILNNILASLPDIADEKVVARV